MKFSYKVHSHLRILVLLIIILSGIICSYAQDSTSSLAFKKNRPDGRVYFYYHSDLSYELWQRFNLFKDANAGNALAEHELGIRYILGLGLPADTVKAAYWIHKAAEQNLPGACFNYGILVNNGWGVNWNPFEAYKYFYIAAQNNMPQAEYIIGISYTDNLTVKRNWSEAYRWLKKSADAGFKPATETLAELKKSISFSKIDTTEADTEQSTNSNKYNASQDNQTALNSSTNLVFVDFNTVSDTVSEIPNKILLQDILHEGNEKLARILKINDKKDTTLAFNPSAIDSLAIIGNEGSPEALTLLGRLYELGIYTKKDITQAAVYYIRAIKLDSPRSPVLLWKMLRDSRYFVVLKKLVEQNDPRAMFVWYGLFAAGIDNQITQEDAINFLKKAASLNYIPALDELGLNLYTGKFLKQDRDKAVIIWQHSQSLGSREASLRILVAEIFGYAKAQDFQNTVDEIQKANAEGSILAQATLAYCYENGIGSETNEAKAVLYYRMAAQRGSRFAFDELKQMYDALRPNDSNYKVD
ncbi:MAG: tetratricopeptide repeat protein [Ignavibacteriaceae bacterium]